MLQEIIIGLVFLGALGYVGRIFYRQFFAKSSAGCAMGCSGCTAIDLKKIEQQIAAANAAKNS